MSAATTQPPGEGPAPRRARLGRRSLLAKGAVAGGLVWVAPVIHAGRAAAAGCTPKCAPPDLNLTVPPIEIIDVCDPFDAGQPYDGLGPTNVTKAAQFKIIATASGRCPCSPGVVPPTIQLGGGVPTQWTKVLTCGDPYSSHDATAVLRPGTSDTFLLYKAVGGGALSDGIYVADRTLCVASVCLDRTGDPVYKRCTFAFCIDYKPAGSCGAVNPNVTITIVPLGCNTSCDPC